MPLSAIIQMIIWHNKNAFVFNQNMVYRPYAFLHMLSIWSFRVLFSSFCTRLQAIMVPIYQVKMVQQKQGRWKKSQQNAFEKLYNLRGCLHKHLVSWRYYWCSLWVRLHAFCMSKLGRIYHLSEIINLFYILLQKGHLAVGLVLKRWNLLDGNFLVPVK